MARTTRTTRTPRLTRRSAFWLWAVAFLIGFVLTGLDIGVNAAVFPDGALVGLLVLLPVLLAGYWFFRRLHPIRSHPRGYALLMIGWGAFSAGGIAGIPNGSLLNIVKKLAGADLADRWGIAIAAPIDEETLKLIGVVLLALMAPQAIRGPLDGFAYGALIGFGFAVLEDYSYVFITITQKGAVQAGSAAVTSLVGRVALDLWFTHWAFTAVSGAGLGYLIGNRERPLAWRLPVAVGAFLFAVIMHAWWDSPFLAGGGWEVLRRSVILISAVAVYRVARRQYLRCFRNAAVAEVSRGVLTETETEILTHRRRRHRELRSTPHGAPRDLLIELRTAELNLIDDDLHDHEAGRALRSEIGRLRSRLEAARS
ncbi:PrsW family intramembrane metalloprotease [Actinoallomurus sp. CA-142502]|uniref:PrsW family intramembrane metalloprotease n=1 Tax=Actinoallomurus sp. CA-142502 TaxID=3239885 RepID=UPI003D8ED2E1